MGGSSSSNRTALLAGGALVAALLGFAAHAQEAPAADQPTATTETSQVDFTDPQTVLRRSNVSMRSDVAQRFGPTNSTTQRANPRPAPC